MTLGEQEEEIARKLTSLSWFSQFGCINGWILSHIPDGATPEIRKRFADLFSDIIMTDGDPDYTKHIEAIRMMGGL